MYLDKNSETKWLIKSENRILGPYSFDQIIDLIRKKQISLIDEVRDSETRWLYVRENPEFKSIVEEMRNEIYSRVDNTVTFQSSSKTVDEYVQKTKTDNQFTDISLEAKDIVVVSETLSAVSMDKGASGADPRKNGKAKTYGVQNDKVIRDRLNSYISKAVLSLMAMVVLSGAAFYGYVYIHKRNAIRQEEELVSQVRKYKILGLDQKVVELFSRLTMSSQKKLIPELLEIYPLLESTGLASVEDIKSLKLNANMSLEQRANNELVYFWLAIQKKDYEKAQDYLVSATTLQPAANLIKENEALLFIKNGKYISAFNVFKNIFSQEKNGRYLLGMVEAYYGLPEVEKPEYSKELLSILDAYTRVYYDYKKELLLAQIAIAHQLNEKVLYKDSVVQFFNVPCRLSSQFIKPSLLISDSYIWSHFKDMTSTIMETLDNDEKLLFQLHNFLEANLLSDAVEFVSVNSAKLNNEEIRTQMNLLLLDAQNRNAEVVALEKLNLLDMNSELNHLLIAKNKIEVDNHANIAEHLQFFDKKQNFFYKDWLKLESLIKMNSIVDLRAYIRDHFITIQNFKPVYVAKGLIN